MYVYIMYVYIRLGNNKGWTIQFYNIYTHTLTVSDYVMCTMSSINNHSNLLCKYFEEHTTSYQRYLLSVLVEI